VLPVINNDKMQDAKIILQYKDSIAMVKDVEEIVATQPEILLILFRNKTGNCFKFYNRK